MRMEEWLCEDGRYIVERKVFIFDLVCNFLHHIQIVKY